MSITLADAIRIGSARSLPGYVKMWHYSPEHPRFALCVMGAAIYGAGIRIQYDLQNDKEMMTALIFKAMERWPELRNDAVCPVCSKKMTLLATLMHLNDTHQRDRPGIADWVDSQTLDLTHMLTNVPAEIGLGS